MKTKFALYAGVVVLASSFTMAQQVSVNYNHDARVFRNITLMLGVPTTPMQIQEFDLGTSSTAGYRGGNATKGPAKGTGEHRVPT